MGEYSKKRVIFGLFLVIIIGLLLLIFLAIKEVGQIGLIPTGNVDIFNIECNNDEDNNCDCTGTNKNDDDYNKNNSNNKNNNSDVNVSSNPDYSSNNTTGSNEEEDYRAGGFTVFDDDANWDSTNELRIFSNPAYEFRNIIAPGSSNAYQFIVNNNQSYNIKYNINFLEENEHNINMLYRLKRNGEYILGNKTKWEKITESNFEEFKLMNKTRDLYTLEWKWVDNDNDTEVSYLKANYVLKINIKAAT